ncbi:MAG: hypothetical protein ABIG84_03090 [archaeon]
MNVKKIYRDSLSKLEVGGRENYNQAFRDLNKIISSHDCPLDIEPFSALAEAAHRISLYPADKTILKEKYADTLEISKSSAQAQLSGNRLKDFESVYAKVYKDLFE